MIYFFALEMANNLMKPLRFTFQKIQHLGGHVPISTLVLLQRSSHVLVKVRVKGEFLKGGTDTGCYLSTLCLLNHLLQVGSDACATKDL